jgi:hypothetical protein
MNKQSAGNGDTDEDGNNIFYETNSSEPIQHFCFSNCLIRRTETVCFTASQLETELQRRRSGAGSAGKHN